MGIGARRNAEQSVRCSDRVGKEIAHLTYGRVKIGPISQDWNITAIHAAMMTLVSTFTASAIQSNLSDKLKTTVAKLAPPTTLGFVFSTSSATNHVTSRDLKVNSVTATTASSTTSKII
jgi:hypothetical protein